MNNLDEVIYEDVETYRDSISTINEKGKRMWIYPKNVTGFFKKYRTIFSIVLLIILFANPFIWIGGHPLFLFNIFERKFVVFGRVFMPQDFHLFALAVITFFVFIILFTITFGRLWCGWACPQTLFMEIVFRKIEYWIEGDANQQRKLNARSWDFDKIWRKTLKQTIFFSIAVLVAHTLMAYLIGIDQVGKIISQPPSQHWAGFIGLIVFSGIFYFVFAYLREQACIVICPYGRLQGVLLSKDSIVVAYDFERGEPRGKIKKNKVNEVPPSGDRGLGDCVDCSLCVQVCPTGIDIRNGTQLECVNCTACIDACDAVMDKIGKPTGLVRYASHNNIAQKKKFTFTPRMIGYSVVLVLLLALQGFLLLDRKEIETTILKAQGQRYTEQPNGNLMNMYNAQVANKSFEEANISFKLKSHKGTIQVIGNQKVAKKQGVTDFVILVEISPKEIKSYKTRIQIEVLKDDKPLETVYVNFLGPI
jgi:cytochrome c oxidase accessory protein FixG